MSAKELLDKQFDWYDKSPTSGIKLYFECVVIDAMEEYATLKLQEQAKEIERLKGDSKEVNDKEIDAFINNYINALPDGWNSRLDMILSMKNAMIEALSYKEKYLTNH